MFLDIRKLTIFVSPRILRPDDRTDGSNNLFSGNTINVVFRSIYTTFAFYALLSFLGESGWRRGTYRQSLSRRRLCIPPLRFITRPALCCRIAYIFIYSISCSHQTTHFIFHDPLKRENRRHGISRSELYSFDAGRRLIASVK
jgi:hypothetical protein